MPSYEASDDDVYAYLVKHYKTDKISKAIIRCVITHVSIIQQARGFKSKKDMYEVIDDCTFQYININTYG